MDKYWKEKQIGSGTFGTVWLVKSKQSQFNYVLKEIDLHSMDNAERQRALTEVTVLAKCKHKNIVRYKDAVIDSSIGKLSIVMEYADSGDLYSAISRQNGIPFAENCVMSWFIQICLALQYIHHRNILHRDLKTQNVFLTRNKVIKVGDFGIAKVLRTSDDLAVTSIGTPYYISPEICLRKPYNFKSDIWALGCVLFEMSCLEHPFKAASLMNLVSLIQTGKRRPFACWCSLMIKELVQLLLQNEPFNRPSADEILAYPMLQPFLSKYVFHHASLATYLVDTRFLPTLEVMPNQSNPIKRTASTNESNIKRNHRLYATSSDNEVFYERSRSASNVSSVNQGSDKISPGRVLTVTQNKTRSLKRPLNDTFIIPNKVKILTPPVIKVDKASDTDCGYQSQEAGILSTTDGKPEKFSPTGKIKVDPSKTATCQKDINYLLNSESFSFSAESIADSEDHANCNHTQCYQCLLDTLWKNRIKGMPNIDEYSKLKEKLLKVFRNLFEKVYQSLLYDWEGNEMKKYRASIQSFIKTLNYEQVQHLPLMMQLIQLEFQMKSLKNKDTNDFPSVML